MTEREVRRRIQKIKDQSGDPEIAHSSEDSLWHDVLYSIAHGDCARPHLMAALALETRDIDFPRWTA